MKDVFMKAPNEHPKLDAGAVASVRRPSGVPSVSLVLLLLLLLLGGRAQAQWQVTDPITHQALEQVNANLEEATNPRLQEIYDQQHIGKARRSTDGGRSLPEAPEIALIKGRPSEVAVNGGEAARCRLAPATKVASLGYQQWLICREIVRTELAQYNYALAMREVALGRQDRLKRIEEARARLDKHRDAGKLVSNSNELLALLVRLEADRQQYRTYMDAYGVRIKYLASLRDALGQQSINGKGTLAQAAVGAGALVALELALDAQKTSRKAAFHK
ncbi:MAG TPA: hypothetical protein VGC74_16100 [Stenotrophomonas sp.]|jgi:hypothetical protein